MAPPTLLAGPRGRPQRPGGLLASCCCCTTDPAGRVAFYHDLPRDPREAHDNSEGVPRLPKALNPSSEEQIEVESWPQRVLFLREPIRWPGASPPRQSPQDLEAPHMPLPPDFRVAAPYTSSPHTAGLLERRQAAGSAAGGGPAGRFAALDFLRLVCALGVSVLHLERGAWFFHGLNGTYAPALYLGLDFFLVLSGFVLSKRHALAPVSPGQFLLQRFLRLWPLHALAVVTTALARHLCGRLMLEPTAWVALDFLQELAMLHCVGLPYPHVAFNNMLSWSVSCEFWVNAVFHLLSACQDRVGLVAMTLLAALMQLALYLQHPCLDVWSGLAFGINPGMLRCGSCFILGLVVSAVHDAVSWKTLTTTAATFFEFVLVVAVLALVYVRPEHCFVSDFAAPWLFGATIFCFARGEGIIAACMAYASSAGKVSYSIYLNQWTVLFCMKAMGIVDMPFVKSSFTLQVLLYWAVLLPYSVLTYTFVERAVLSWWEGKLKPIFTGLRSPNSPRTLSSKVVVRL